LTVFITDFITKPNIEKKILGNILSKNPTENISVLLVWHQICDKSFINKFPNLKAIIRYGVGVDNIDLKYAKKKNIKVANTPDYGVDEVSDTAISFLMMITRKTYEYNDELKLIRNYQNIWQERRKAEIVRSSHHNICSIGAGRIGSSFIKKANAIGFNTFFYDPFLPRGYDKVLKSKRLDSLDEVAINCNIISVHCPLNQNTYNLLNENFFKKLKKRSIIINTARGGIVNEKSLSKHIISKKLYFAADVLEEEPIKINHDLMKLWTSKKYSNQILINPHTAFYSKQAFKEMRENASKNALKFIKNGELYNQVI